jgi:UDP-N-acetylmuramoyl-tripeptide--D-alanyl-D-alanine ligase
VSALRVSMIAEWLHDGDYLVGDAVAIGAPMVGEIGRVCTDSRLAQPGSLFVALVGERVDGHRFIDEANRNGAIAALVSHERLADLRRSLPGSITLLPVTDQLAALQYLATRWRSQFSELLRVGVTGSNGKTTTKEMIASVLSHLGPTVRSSGNFNSEIGLPMEILKIRSRHVYGVFEMGINRVGEMELLASLVEPNVALITNIGTAHIGMFGSRDGLIREKAMIFSKFADDSVAVIPDSDEIASAASHMVPGTVIRYTRETAGIEDVEYAGLDGSVLHLSSGDVRLRIPGRRMVENATAALTVCRLLGAEDHEIIDGLEAVQPVAGRSEVIPGAVTVIQDAYNANPESVRASLDLLAEADATRRIAVIGAMKELGDFAPDAHRGVYEDAVARGFDELWLVGDEFLSVVPATSGRVRSFADDNWAELENAARGLREGDIVLLKGSRTVALERLLPVIQERAG